VEESASTSNKSKEKVFPGSGYANVVNREIEMTDKEAMKLALEALELVNLEFLCNGAHHEKKDRHEHDEACPVTMRYRTAIAALEERLKNPKKWVIEGENK